QTVNATMFAPCANVVIAAQKIAELRERCKTSPHLKGDPTYCAVAVYRGSWQRPNSTFADAVRTSVVKNDAPDFEMPADTSLDSGDMGSAAPPALPQVAATPTTAPDDPQRAWSSPLFPAKRQQFERTSGDGSTVARSTAGAQRFETPSAAPTHAIAQAD